MTRRTVTRSPWATGLAALGLLATAALPVGFASRAIAQDTRQAPQAQQAQQDLPAAKDVLQKYVDATGGKEAYEKLKTQTATGSFAMPAMGINGQFELHQHIPDKMLLVITIPGIGKVQQGLNGDVAWELSDMSGPRLLTETETAARKREADPAAVTDPDKYYQSVEVLGAEELNGVRTYRLRMVPKDSGQPQEAWYDADSGLLLKTSSTQEGPMGQMKVETSYDDYREVGDVGLKQPHKITANAGGMQQVITLNEITANPEHPADRFEPPAEIKQLQGQQNQGQPNQQPNQQR